MAKILGIEVGSSVTRICEMDYKTKNPKLYKYICIPTPKGVVDDGMLEENPEFTLAIKKALSDNKITTRQVIFTVSSNKIVTREAQIPAVKLNQVASYIRANSTDYFPVDLTLYELAHVVLGTVKTDDGKEKLRVMIIAAGKELIAGYAALAASCGLKVVSVDYAGNSVYQIMKDECVGETDLVIKVEESSTIATVISNHTMELQRNLAYGIDKAVKTLMDAPEYAEDTYEDAFNLMCRRACVKATLSDRTRQIEPDISAGESEAMTEARKRITENFGQLVSNLARMIELHNSKNRENPITRITLIGLGSDINGLYKLFTNELGLPTRVMKNVEGVSYFQSVDQESLGRYVAAIGATFGPINLLGEVSKQKSKKTVDYGKITVLVGVLSVAVMGAMCALSIPKYMDTKEENEELVKKEAEYSEAEALYNQYASLQELYTQVLAQYNATQCSNDNLVEFFGELEQTLPGDSYLMSFTSDRDTAVLTIVATSYEEAGKIIENMRHFDSLMNVNVASIAETEEDEAMASAYNREVGNVVQFELVCYYYPSTTAESAE